MKIECRRATEWNRALNAARRTVGKERIEKEPSDDWKAKILLAEHSPIRLVEFDFTVRSIRQWVTTHLVRHFIGFLPFVSTQREDRKKLDCSRDELPQGSLNDMDISANAQSLINVSRRRLCSTAAKETREAWNNVKLSVSKIDPIVASKMVPECIYRGFCPELKCCGFAYTEKYANELKEYRAQSDWSKNKKD